MKSPSNLQRQFYYFLNKFRYGVAEIDCSLAIELDPKYTKAYYRRANARVKLKKYEDARKDYEQVLKLEPSNKAAQAELASLESLIDGHQLVFPINKPEGQRSKKPLKTILIEEINSDSVNKIELEKNLEEIKQRTKLDAKDEKLFGHGSSDNHSVEVKPNKIEKLGKEVQSLKLDEKLEIKKLIPDRPQNGYQFKKDWQSLKSNLIDLSVYLKARRSLSSCLYHELIMLVYRKYHPAIMPSCFRTGLRVITCP